MRHFQTPSWPKFERIGIIRTKMKLLAALINYPITNKRYLFEPKNISVFIPRLSDQILL